MVDEKYMELVERASVGPFQSEQEGYKEVPLAAVDIRTFEKEDGWYITWRRIIRGPTSNPIKGMTDEEARQGIRDKFRPDWLIGNLLAVYERYRTKGLSPPKASEQTNLCYMATHGAANYDAETGLFSEVQWGESQ